MKVVVALIVLVAVLFVIAVLIPRHHVASVSRLIHGSPASVYAVIRNAAAAPQWRKEVQRVEVIDATHFREHAKYGTVTYEIVEDKPADRYVTRITDQNLGYGGSWTYEFAPENGGTRVTITENGEVSNLLFRLLSRFVFGYEGNIKKVLEQLAAKFDTAPRPSEGRSPAR
jgi:uncharacterized protein YndB with AHSA1/START domain